MEEALFLVGRILFVYLFIGSGIAHLTQTAGMAGYAASKGVSNAALMVQVSGVAMIVGGASVALGIFGDLGALGLAVLSLILAVVMHPFWKETDAMAKQNEMVAFNKDVALAGGALAIFALFAAVDGYGFFTITGSVF